MKVVIFDYSGSVSESALEAGADYIGNSLEAEVEPRNQILSQVFWTTTPANGRAISLERLVSGFKSIDPQCDITLITDGMLTYSEIECVDHIAVYGNANGVCPAHVVPEIKAKLSAIIPVYE